MNSAENREYHQKKFLETLIYWRNREFKQKEIVLKDKLIEHEKRKIETMKKFEELPVVNPKKLKSYIKTRRRKYKRNLLFINTLCPILEVDENATYDKNDIKASVDGKNAKCEEKNVSVPQNNVKERTSQIVKTFRKEKLDFEKMLLIKKIKKLCKIKSENESNLIISVRFSNIKIYFSKNFVKNKRRHSNFSQYFLCVVSCGKTILASQIVCRKNELLSMELPNIEMNKLEEPVICFRFYLLETEKIVFQIIRAVKNIVTHTFKKEEAKASFRLIGVGSFDISKFIKRKNIVLLENHDPLFVQPYFMLNVDKYNSFGNNFK